MMSSSLIERQGVTWTIGDNSHPMPSSVWVEGIDAGSVSLLLAVAAPKNDGVGSADKVAATVRKVTKVEFIQRTEEGYGQLAVGKNPDGTSGTPSFMGGDQFFPDPRTYALKSQAENMVRVHATVQGAQEGDLVFFRSYDVDDPSTNRIIDPNGDGENGSNDNRGRLADVAFDAPGSSAGAPAEAAADDENGFKGYLADVGAGGGRGNWHHEDAVVSAVVRKGQDGALFAEVDLATSFAPGDNFRVGATFNENAITGRNTIPTTGNSSDPQGRPHDASPQLSVWRRFHIETDRMASTEGEKLSGRITENVNGSLGEIDIKTDITLDPANFDGGILRYREKNYLVLRVTEGADSTVTVLGSGDFAADGAITIYDNTFSAAVDQQEASYPLIVAAVTPVDANGVTGVTLPRDMSANEFAGGVVKFGGKYYVVEGNDGTTIFVKFGADPAPAAEDAVELYRPVTNAAPSAQVDTEVDSGLYDMLQPTTNRATNRYADAYLEPDLLALSAFDSNMFAGALPDEQAFVPATAFIDTQGIGNVIRHYKGSVGTEVFWVVYVTTGFSESPGVGMGRDYLGRTAHDETGAIIYLEDIHLASETLIGAAGATNENEIRARTTVHEIGHQFDLARGGRAEHMHREKDEQDHALPNIMRASQLAMTSAQYYFYSMDIAALRDTFEGPGTHEAED